MIYMISISLHISNLESILNSNDELKYDLFQIWIELPFLTLIYI